jgi:hypothetical protein
MHGRRATPSSRTRRTSGPRPSSTSGHDARSPSSADHSTLWAPRDVRALGADGCATSETGFTLDRTQHDLLGRRGAENAALTRMRFRYGWQMIPDLGIMPFPKGQGMGAASDVRVVPLTGSPHAQQQNASDSRPMWPRRNCDLPGGSPEPHSHSRWSTDSERRPGIKRSNRD